MDARHLHLLCFLTMKRPKRLHPFVFLVVLLAVLSIAAFNILVDPYGIFRVVSIAGFNQGKIQQAKFNSRGKKSLDLFYNDYDLVLLGSSRVEFTFQRGSPAFTGKRVYNCGMRMANMSEIIPAMDFIRKHGSARRVFIGLDWVAFRKGTVSVADFDESLFAGKGLVSLYLTRMLSWRALDYSLQTVADNMAGKTGHMTGDGFSDYPQALSAPGLFSRTLHLYRASPDFQYRYTFDPELAGRLEKALLMCLDQGIKADLAIMPVHVRLLEQIWDSNQWGKYAQWIRDLVEMAERLRAATNGRFSGKIWNFSSYGSRIIHEPYRDGLSGRYFDYFYDPAHTTHLVGDYILDKVFGLGLYPEIHFGELIDRSTIHSYLESEEARHYALLAKATKPDKKREQADGQFILLFTPR
jgi:hypothetical protein